jgi:hypothetical protein
MKKPAANPTENKCPRCNGTGFPVVKQPAQPNRKIYPAPCTKCGGRGRRQLRPLFKEPNRRIARSFWLTFQSNYQACSAPKLYVVTIN